MSTKYITKEEKLKRLRYINRRIFYLKNIRPFFIVLELTFHILTLGVFIRNENN